ncbi:MAG TPA: biotin/lipoate A/B protein ligase family protein [Thermoplasmata archaeon]|nr:biotin/lipoate A/B protein ligase family protein [Thermoplasmata archaeon]
MGATWRWLDLGAVDGATMVNVFVALAAPVARGRSPPTAIVLYPQRPFANVGYHQEAEREVDVPYCRANGIPVVRRVVGGGAILDGPWEHDYMIIVPPGAPGTENGVAGFYERYLAPVTTTLGRLGVVAPRSGVNDLAVGRRKISANGAMQLEGSWILVGDILLDLDIPAMSRVLRVPDEKFRGKLATGMAEWLTSVRAETGRLPGRSEVSRILAEEFARAFGIEVAPGALSPEEAGTVEELRSSRTADAWTFAKDRSHPNLSGAPSEGRAVKISGDAVLARLDRKAGKLVRVTLLHGHGRIEEVEFSGDFFTHPFDAPLGELEKALGGSPLVEANLRDAIGGWLTRKGVHLVGATSDDLAAAIVAAASIAPASR